MVDQVGGISDVDEKYIIARSFDIGDGKKNYVVFADQSYLLPLYLEADVVKAGRAKPDGCEPELHTDYSNASDYLIVSPQGAYAYPAQITSQKGITTEGKPLSQILFEVGKNLRTTS